MAAWNLSIGKSSRGRYPLTLRTPGDTYRFSRALPPNFSDFATCPPRGKTLRWRRPLDGVDHDELLFCAADLGTLKEIGDRLHASLFRFRSKGKTKDLTDAFLMARAGAPDKEAGLGFVIDLTEAPELARVPWEALYLADQDLLLGVDTGTNIVRRIEPGGNAGLPPPIRPPIRMLVAVANLGSELEARTEMGNIESRLGSLRTIERFEVQALETATRKQLRARIVKWKPHVIHFIGHGGFDDDKGLIYLHSGKDPQQRDAIDSRALRDLVRNNPPWLVVLNSCLSGAAAATNPFAGAAQNLIRANVPFVVAMQAPISDDAAIAFSEEFYSALESAAPVGKAVSSGRDGILSLEDESLQPELITPVLYTNGLTERIALLGRSGFGSYWRVICADVKKSGVAQALLTFVGVVVPLVLALVVADGDERRAVPDPYGSPNAEAPAEAIATGDFLDDMGAAGGPAEAVPGTEDEVLHFGTRRDPGREEFATADAGRAGRPPARRAHARSLPPPTGRPIQLAEAPAAVPPDPGPPPAAVPPPPTRGTPPPAATSSPVPNVARPPASSAPAAAYVGAAVESASARRQAEMLRRRYFELRRARRNPSAARSPPRPRSEAEILGAVIGYAATSSATGNYAWVAGAVPSAYRSGESLALVPDLVASFAPGAVVPTRIDISRHAAILLSPTGESMLIELVGTADPSEPSDSTGELGLRRAESVAEALRGSAVPEERIVVASAADRWARSALPPYRYEWKRHVEARLVLRDADRIPFAFGSAEVAGDNAGRLDRLAAFARGNPDVILNLQGHAQASEEGPFPLSRLRAESVREQLRRRGVDDLQTRLLLFGDSHPEVVGQPGPDADRRVQIVLVPRLEVGPETPNAPPPDPPRQP